MALDEQLDGGETDIAYGDDTEYEVGAPLIIKHGDVTITHQLPESASLSDVEVGAATAFNRLVRELSRRGDVYNPRALAAWIGRRKLGAAGMARLAAAGRHRLGDLDDDPVMGIACAVDLADFDGAGLFDSISIGWQPWLENAITHATDAGGQRWVGFAMGVQHAIYENEKQRNEEIKKSGHATDWLEGRVRTLKAYEDPRHQYNIRPDDPFWRSSEERKRDHAQFMAYSKAVHWQLHTHFDPGGFIQKAAGWVLHTTLALTPFDLAVRIAKGERLDHALVGHFKAQLSVARDIAPYAETVVSFIPGIGTGVGAAIGAGVALAEGRSITDAAIAGIRGAIPGGQLAQAGFDTAMKVAKGENVGKAVLEGARETLPPAAQHAFDIGLAVATGKSLQNALVSALGAALPKEQIQTILDAGTKALKAAPALTQIAQHLDDQGRAGFRLAAGLLAHRGVNEAALTAVRNRLKGAQREGFDALVKHQAQHVPWLHEVVSGPTAQESIAAHAASIPGRSLVRMVGGKPALLFPVTLPATAALIAADRVMRVAEGQRGTPVQRQQMAHAIVNTSALARSGNKEAQAALHFMALAKNLRGAQQIGGKVVQRRTPKPGEPGHPATRTPKPGEPHARHAKYAATVAFVHPNGVIEHHAWKRGRKGARGSIAGPIVHPNGRIERGVWSR